MQTKKPFDRKNSIRCVEYWVARGYTEEQAREEISKRQKRTPEVYKNAANAKKTKEFKEKQSKKMKDVYTLKYWVEKLGDVEGPIKYEEIINRSKQNGLKTAIVNKTLSAHERKERSPFCVEYWAKRGYTIEDAITIISLKQERGLNYFINKYGEVDGLARWKDRQIRWQETFQTNNNMSKVNEKRRQHAHVGLYTEENVKHIDLLFFYLVKFSNNNETFLKYGLTKRSNGATDRWGHTKYGASIETLIEWKTTGNHSFELEQSIKNNFKQYAYTPKLFSTTEALSIVCENELLKYVNNFISSKGAEN